MPKCFLCRSNVPSDDLSSFGANARDIPEDELGCPECRKTPISLVGAEEVMSDKKKAIASIEIFSEGDDNYEIVGYIRVGGMKLEVDTDIERIRDFFTRRKAIKATKEKVRKLSLQPVGGDVPRA